MSLHHKNCGGELYVKEWTDYGVDDFGVAYGQLPDFYCRKCGDFIMGDAQIQESMDDIQNSEYGAK